MKTDSAENCREKLICIAEVAEACIEAMGRYGEVERSLQLYVYRHTSKLARDAAADLQNGQQNIPEVMQKPQENGGINVLPAENIPTPTGDPQPGPDEIEIHSSDPRLKEFGYLPGGYMWGKCRDCKKELNGVAKYSTRCFDCASAKLIQIIRNPAPQGAPSPAPAGAAIIRMPETKELREKFLEGVTDILMWSGCFTGDCPHHKQTECEAAVLEVGKQVAAEFLQDAASPPPVQAPAAGPLGVAALCPVSEDLSIAIDALKYIQAHDRSPVPAYGEAVRGKKTKAKGSRWITPREKARIALDALRKRNSCRTANPAPLAGAPSAGRPGEGKEDSASGSPQRAGDGQIREAIDRAIDEFHDACMELGSDSVYGADIKNAQAKVAWKRKVLSALLGEASPKAEQSPKPIEGAGRPTGTWYIENKPGDPGFVSGPLTDGIEVWAIPPGAERPDQFPNAGKMGSDDLTDRFGYAAAAAIRQMRAEGAGRPMTWTREAVNALLADEQKAFMSLHEKVDRAYSKGRQQGYRDVLALETSEAKSGERSDPAHPPECLCKPCLDAHAEKIRQKSEAMVIPAPIPEAKADPGQDNQESKS